VATAGLNRFSAGESHTCGLHMDGTVACWGNDHRGKSSPPSGTFTQISAGEDHSCGIRTDGTVSCWGFNGHGYTAVPDNLHSDPGLFQPPSISFDESRLLNISTNGPVIDFGLQAGFIVQGQAQRFVLMGENMGGMGNPVLRLFNLSDNALIEQNNNWQDHPTASEVQSRLRSPGHSLDSAFAISLSQGLYYAELQDGYWPDCHPLRCKQASELRNDGGGQGLVSVTAIDAAHFQQTYPINLSTRGSSPLTAGFIVNGDSSRCFIVKAEGPYLGGGAISDPALIVRRYDPTHPDGGEIIDANNNWADHPSAEMVITAGFAPADAREAALAVRLTQGVYLAELYSVFKAEKGGDSIVAVTELPETFLQQASCDTDRITKATPTISAADQVNVVILQPNDGKLDYYEGNPIPYQAEVISNNAATPLYQWDFGLGAQLSAGNATDGRGGVVRYGSSGSRTVQLSVRVNGLDYQAKSVEVNVLERDIRK